MQEGQETESLKGNELGECVDHAEGGQGILLALSYRDEEEEEKQKRLPTKYFNAFNQMFLKEESANAVILRQGRLGGREGKQQKKKRVNPGKAPEKRRFRRGIPRIFIEGRRKKKGWKRDGGPPSAAEEDEKTLVKTNGPVTVSGGGHNLRQWGRTVSRVVRWKRQYKKGEGETPRKGKQREQRRRVRSSI